MRLERDKKFLLTFGQMSFQWKTDDITDDSETNSVLFMSMCNLIRFVKYYDSYTSPVFICINRTG